MYINSALLIFFEEYYGRAIAAPWRRRGGPGHYAPSGPGPPHRCHTLPRAPSDPGHGGRTAPPAQCETRPPACDTPPPWRTHSVCAPPTKMTCTRPWTGCWPDKPGAKTHWPSAISPLAPMSCTTSPAVRMQERPVRGLAAALIPSPDRPQHHCGQDELQPPERG